MAKNDEGSMWWEHSRDKAKRQQSSFGRNNDKDRYDFHGTLTLLSKVFFLKHSDKYVSLKII